MEISRGKAGAPPRTVYIKIGIWKDGDIIHVAHNDPEGPSTFHVSVGPDGSKPGGHPKLYEELSKCLAALPVAS
jgi:hypothetical protein